MQLSVIIISFNVKCFLEQCLCSVLAAGSHLETEVIVVDNASTDGTRQFLEHHFPTVRFIWNDSNKGFSKANNQALGLAKGETILFLNPDTIVPEDCFEKCIDFFGVQKNAGAIGIHMVDGNGRFLKESKRAFPSPMTSLFKLAGFTDLFPRSKIFARYYLGHLPENINHEVEVLAGAFMMMPKRVLDRTGGFDERFFMYGEDIDLSYRVQQAGFRNFYISACSIIHFKGESTKKGSLRYTKMFYRAMDLFVTKHYGKGRAGFYALLIRTGIFLHAFFAVLSNTLQATGSFILAKTRKERNGASRNNRTLIVSGRNEYERIVKSLHRAGRNEMVMGRVGLETTPEHDTIGQVGQLKEIIATHAPAELVFCERGIGFAAIIRILQGLPHNMKTRFHAAGSHCIAGSDKPEENGECIFIEQGNSA